MNKLLTTTKYLPVTLAFAALAFASNNASAQGASAAPQTYNAAVDSIDGVNAQAPSAQPFARARSTDNSGYSALAQAPATIHHPGAPSSW
jgi:hypothetical protein